MNKRQYCESRESIAYYSGLNGLEIKGIEHGIEDYIYCVSGAWGGGKAFHRVKVQYNRKGAAFSSMFDIVEVSKNKTYWFFGARFERGA